MANMLFANNANTTLASSLTNVATTMSVTSASAFPSPTGSQYFYCTLADAATQTTIEIVKVTAVSGTTFTIVRGQDGTSGTAFASGAVVSLRLVRASLNDFPKLDESNTFTQLQTINTIAVSGSTSTTPVLSFNASNCPIASGTAISGSYLQFVLQNTSGTASASTNYVLSNDLGTDSSYYGEFGMNSSIYSSGTPADFFSINNGVYFSGHDGDITIGSGNGKKLYLAWGTSGGSAHVINASGAIGLNTNLASGTGSGTTNFGTAGQPLLSGGSSATPTWGTLGVAAGGTGLTSLTAGYIPYGNGTSAFSSSSNLTFDGTNLYSLGQTILGTGSALGTNLLTLRTDAGASNTPAIVIDEYGSTLGSFAFRRTGGTIASPTATTATSIISILGTTTGDGTTFANTAAIQSLLEATATPTSQPTAFTFAVTPVGSTSRTERLRITSAGAMAFSGATNYGSSGQALQSNGNAAPTWGTLGVAGGGTGLATLTSGQILYASGTTTVAQSSALTFNGTTFSTTNDASIHGCVVGRGAGTTSTNVAFGSSALAANTSSDYNTAIGNSALAKNTSGASNTAVGLNTLNNITTGSQNTAVGDRALTTCTSSDNTAVGYLAALSLNTGTQNTVVGRSAFQSGTGNYNTVMGYLALLGATSDNNVAIGLSALQSLSSGAQCIAIGSNAATALATGSNDIIIGYNAAASTTSVSNEITLGNGSIATLRCQVTTITSLSDERDKTNIKPLKAGLDFINRIDSVEFDWNARDKSKVGIADTGFIAQQLKKVQEDTGIHIPGLVYEENPEKLEAGYGKLIPVLVKALQELNEKFDAYVASHP